MKYYELMRYADNPVGADFTYCTDEDLNDVSENFDPDFTDEVTKKVYEEGLERQHRKFLRLATGYPKK